MSFIDDIKNKLEKYATDLATNAAKATADFRADDIERTIKSDAETAIKPYVYGAFAIAGGSMLLGITSVVVNWKRTHRAALAGSRSYRRRHPTE